MSLWLVLNSQRATKPGAWPWCSSWSWVVTDTHQSPAAAVTWMRVACRQGVSAVAAGQDRQRVTTGRTRMHPVTVLPLCLRPPGSNYLTRQECVIIMTDGYTDPVSKQEPAESPVQLAAAPGDPMNSNSRIGGGLPA